MSEGPNANLDELPAAVPARSLWGRLPLVWILPAVVILAGAFVVVREKIAQGTSIEIRFENAEGLEVNKTKVRYKDVDIGEVRDIRVGEDRKEVIVTADIHRNATSYLVEDTRFWVVRPRISGAGVSGLATLVSGAYISVDVGHSTVKRDHFVGLEVPPIVTADLPGREFILHADDLGSLDIGSSVFYRHINAGQVVGYNLDPGGTGVTIKVFINCAFRHLCHERYAILAGERHRHVRERRWGEAANRIPHVDPRRRCGVWNTAGRGDCAGRGGHGIYALQ